MIERIKSISNPLTIIAIFAALAEILGTVALANVDKELQHIFIWFVMLFPVFLVTAFFLTLNLNPKVLYAPSDFREEKHFMGLLSKTTTTSRELGDIAKDIDNTRIELSELVSKLNVQNHSERENITRVINQSLDRARENLAAQQGKVLNMAKVFIDPRTTGDIRDWPNEVDCPKCGGRMLKTECGDYHCHNCGNLE